MKQSLLLFFLAGLLFFACKKENELYRIDPVALSYVQLKQRQYFIYKNVVSGTTDSVVVTESSLGTTEITSSNWFGTGNASTQHEMYSLTLTKKGSGVDSAWLQGQLLGEPGYQSLKGAGGDYFIFPSYDNSYSYMLPVYIVEGTTYTNVIVSAETSGMDINYRCTYYWAPSTGLVKVIRNYHPQYPDAFTQTYTLLRHN